MREILFKAKRLDNGDWVEGDLIHYKSGETAILKTPFSMHGYEATEIANRIRVDPKTVCQYTGLKDKNGKKIWENDVIKIDKPSHIGVYVVKYVEGGFQYANLNENYSFCFDDTEYYMHPCDCEVIGNIFDNPELLEVTENE